MSGHVLLTISDEAAALLALSSGLAPFNDLLDPEGPEVLRVLTRARLEWSTLPDNRVHVWWSMLDPAGWQRVQQRLHYLSSHDVDMVGMFYGTIGDRLEMAHELLTNLPTGDLPAWSITVQNRNLICGSPTLLSPTQLDDLNGSRAALLARIENDLDFYQVFSSAR